eukprot:scaffold332_cov308-Pavlova_lutheri.AAC.4
MEPSQPTVLVRERAKGWSKCKACAAHRTLRSVAGTHDARSLTRSLRCAYPAGSGGVGGDSTGKGGGGGGGGGNWFGFGGSSDGFSMGPLTWVFAAFLSLGGLVAYLKKGSLKSLVTSLLAAGTLAASMLLRSRNLALASRMQIATAGTLTLLMGLRYLNNPSSVPAGVVTVASLLMTLGYAKDP